MKNQRVFLLSALLLGFIVVLDACKYFDNVGLKKYPTSKTFNLKGKDNKTVKVETPFSPNELILFYSSKDSVEWIALQRDYLLSKGFKKADSCDCTQNLELWRHPSTNPGEVDLITVVDGAPKPKPRPIGDGIYLNYTLDDGIPKDQKFQDTDNVDTTYSPVNSGRKITVAVVDAGVAYKHPDLKPRIWQNPSTSDCNKAKWGLNTQNPAAEPKDENGHGSIVSGIVLGLSRPVESPMGVSINTMNIRFIEGSSNTGSLFDGLCGILYALDNGVKVINLSWGFMEEEANASIFNPILREAEAKGAILVAGMGNNEVALDGSARFWPACFAKNSKSVVAVVAMNAANQLASFSNWTTDPGMVYLGAPGVDIVSTCPPGLRGMGNNGYVSHSGTSMATPFVARTLAIMLARDNTKTPEQLRTIIRSSSIPTPSPVPGGGSITVPVLKHEAAIMAVPEI